MENNSFTYTEINTIVALFVLVVIMLGGNELIKHNQDTFNICEKSYGKNNFTLIDVSNKSTYNKMLLNQVYECVPITGDNK